MTALPANSTDPADSLAAKACALVKTDKGRRLIDYWFGLPRDGLLPPRQAFDPVDIKDLLPMVMLRDITADGTSTCRLVGTGITELTGQDFTARTTERQFPPAERERHLKSTQVMFSQPCGLVADLHLTSAGGQALAMENVSMPFAPSKDGTWQTLAVFAMLAHDHIYIDGKVTMSGVGPVHFIDVGAGAPPAM